MLCDAAHYGHISINCLTEGCTAHGALQGGCAGRGKTRRVAQLRAREARRAVEGKLSGRHPVRVPGRVLQPLPVSPLLEQVYP